LMFRKYESKIKRGWVWPIFKVSSEITAVIISTKVYSYLNVPEL